MANQWLRLWHDMPTDPKWIVVAEKSGQPIALVLAVFVHMLVNASQSPKRGTLHHWSDEDVAAALRTQPNAIELVRTHMNGKVLDGDRIKGWETRQPKREDGSSERAKAWRESKKRENERNRTQTNATERPDKDTDKEKKDNTPLPPRMIRMPHHELPPEWKEQAMQEKAWSEQITLDVWSNFRDYWQTGKGRNTKREDWGATWRNWYRKENIKQGGNNGKVGRINGQAGQPTKDERARAAVMRAAERGGFAPQQQPGGKPVAGDPPVS